MRYSLQLTIIVESYFAIFVDYAFIFLQCLYGAHSSTLKNTPKFAAILDISITVYIVNIPTDIDKYVYDYMHNDLPVFCEHKWWGVFSSLTQHL